MTVTKQDIETKARELAAAVEETRESVKNKTLLVGTAIAVVVVAAFLWGRRRGSRNKTMVEVYRV